MTEPPTYPLASTLAPALIYEEAEENTGVCGRLKKRWQSLYSAWHTSRQFRTLTFVATTVLIAMILIGWVVISVMRSHIFDNIVATDLERYEGSYTSVQALLSTANSPTDTEIQNIADQVISSQYDATHEVIGAVLLLSVSDTTVQLKPSTETTAELRTLISEDFRRDVSKADTPQWRTVDVPDNLHISKSGGKSDSQVEVARALIIGQVADVPGGGNYEFYVVYSLSGEDNIIAPIRVPLMVGFLALFAVFVFSIYVAIRSVLRPVRKVAVKAQQIADGDYDVRMEVKGKDELAQLSRAFNRMATSIQDQFARYERVANVQQGFVSAVSHELRSPVTTIRMAGQLMYDKRDELPASLRRSVELQQEQLTNLDTMLSDLLEISRYDAGAMELNADETLVSAIVEKAVADQIPLAEAHGVDVEIVVEGDTTVEGERRRIERIIRNLIVNALEHSEGKAVRVRVVGGESAVAVEVSDRGVGLTEKQAADVFKRFWRADSSRVRKSGGTGLGMTLAREDAELHGGTLECVGVLGVGSTFLLTLPRVAGAEFEPPVPLAVAALEDEWGSGGKADNGRVDNAAGESMGNTASESIEDEGSESAEAGSATVSNDVQDEAGEDLPDVMIDEDSKGRPIQVQVPSAGVAVITRPDDSD